MATYIKAGFLRFIFPLLLFPGMLVGVVPLLLALLLVQPSDGSDGVCVFGFFLVIPAFLVIFYCTHAFARHNQTILPWEKPRELLTSGLYGVSRNPIFVAMLVASLGWTIYFLSIFHLIYTFVLFGIFTKRIQDEEKKLQTMFNGAWDNYCSATPRWF